VSLSAPRSDTPARYGPRETGRPIPYVDQVALDFPELVIVAGHIGYPWTQETHTKSGSRKVLFGTNYPMIPHHSALEGIEHLGLTEDTMQLYLEGNAARIFQLRESRP
jgi:predicted TIM-barrel fold metal-dependent hydrolase